MSTASQTKAAKPEVKPIIITRTSRAGKKYTYEAKIIQQPRIARACGQGEKATKDRRPVDPPPVVQLQIFEGEGPDRVEVSQHYPANFFVHAAIEWDGPSKAEASTKLLAGSTNTGGSYLSAPCKAIFFVFGDLSVRYEGFFKLKFHIFEMPFCHHDEILDVVKDAGQNNNLLGVDGVFATNRMYAQSARFEVFSAKKFPGLAESTRLSRSLSDQGCKVRIRRDVRTRKHAGKDTPMGGDEEMKTDDEDDETEEVQDQYPITPLSAKPSEADRKDSVTASLYSVPTPVQQSFTDVPQYEQQQQQQSFTQSQQSQAQSQSQSQAQSQHSSQPSPQSSTTSASQQQPSQQSLAQAQYPPAQPQPPATNNMHMPAPAHYPQPMPPPPYPHMQQPYGPPHMPPPHVPYAYGYPPPTGYSPYPYGYPVYPHPYPPPYQTPMPMDPRYTPAPPQPQQMQQTAPQQTMPLSQQPGQSPVSEQHNQQIQPSQHPPQQPQQQQFQRRLIIDDPDLASLVPGYYYPKIKPPAVWARGSDAHPPEHDGPYARDYNGDEMPISHEVAATIDNFNPPPPPPMWASEKAKAARTNGSLKRSFGEYSRHDDESEFEPPQDDDEANEQYVRQAMESLRRGVIIKRAGINNEMDLSYSHAQAEAAVRGYNRDMAAC